MTRSPVVIVVSIAKSGTHLIGELMKALGYRVFGPSGPGGFGSPPTPQILEKLYTDPLSLPPDTCVVVHSLPITGVRDEVSVNWHRTGQPAILLNYRDPRDVVCSGVRFLMRQSEGGGFAQSGPALAHSAILHAMESDDERLMHVITNPTYPYHDVYRELSWLLLHPLVLNVSFENLVGAAGGGDDEEQVRQVAAVMKHLSIMGDPRRFAEKIYRRDTPVFSKGRIGSWQREFNPAHVAAFNQRFREVLEMYDYEVVEADGYERQADEG